jgi:hypothetical protein
MAVVSPNVIRASGAHLALIERDEPLATLARHLAEAAAGSGRFVVVRGEAGIGKTALLREFLRTCPTDVAILVGACDGVSTPQPFGPLEDMVAALGPELRALLDANASRVEVEQSARRGATRSRNLSEQSPTDWYVRLSLRTGLPRWAHVHGPHPGQPPNGEIPAIRVPWRLLRQKHGSRLGDGPAPAGCSASRMFG